ncbi:hypothetical protein BKA61DRAFT_28170 [Leptodontidium sp. MPI-SDFR-AT-0119]|nr:hypothetical protein BKA61DRAFT_28170 [Leptodontidium sp. MPI-SDFR-AT-0119]
MGDLHPIVIPPLEHTFKSIKFTCSGEGLYKDGYLYDSHAEKLIPPKNTKAGSEPKEFEKKPVAYWKAQCAFRGLNQTGAIADLQLRLREAKKKILPEIKSIETELNKEFKKKNKAARNDSWTSLKSVEQKAKSDPKKYLAEAFPKGGSGRPANLDIVVLKIGADERLAVSDAAEAMGLESVSVDAPWTSNKKPNPDRWVIIGRTRDAVWNQMRDIEREVGRSKQTFSIEKTKPQSAKKVESTPSIKNVKAASNVKSAKQDATSSASTKAVPRARSPLRMGPLPRPRGGRTLQTARKSAFVEPVPRQNDQSSSEKETNNAWDITGEYNVDCPAIESEWGPRGGLYDPLKLDIYLETKNGKRQLYGAFDFRVIEGVMRFEKPVPVPKAEKSESSKKRKKEDGLDDDGDVNMDQYPEFASNEGPNDYSENVFHLGAKDRPTARRPVWRYRWRGTETGEGEIQLGSDRAVRSITFSEKGTKVSGTFICDYTRECHFTGTKVSAWPRNGYLDPDVQWGKHSRAAHEEAERSRWGGGRGGW